MSGTDTVDPSPDAESVAAGLRDASFVTLFAGRDGDATAAAGLLAAALREVGVPFQVTPTDDPDGCLAGRDLEDGTDDRTVAVGRASRLADHTIPEGTRSTDGQPASARAYRAALELGAHPDPTYALAGATAAGTIPGDDGTAPILDRARERGSLRRRPGIGLATDVIADGIAHSTRLLGPFSGDVDRAREVLTEWGLPADPLAAGEPAADEKTAVEGEGPTTEDPTTEGTELTAGALDEADHERSASLVAIEVATATDAVPHAATAVEDALHPYETDGPFPTLAGYADVLDALALERPGIAIGLALDPEGTSLRADAIEAWRDHARRAHRAIREARTGRYDGSVLARVDADPAVLPTVARLLCDFRSPEPAVVVVDAGETSGINDTTPPRAAAAASREPLGLAAALSAAATAFGGFGSGTATRATARFDGDPTEFAAAVREQL